MSPGDVSLACASLLVDELVRGGVRHACLSPGSRSTPIALALARQPAITVHVHLDERSSAFVALGIAKASGEPVAIVCTSGTAAAELLPAAVEASQARVPLVLLTADRPPELRGTGANQTIDQVGLYGGYARAEIETPLPRSGDGRAWRDAGARAVRRAMASPAGPVHVNLPFDEPLTPEGAMDADAWDGGLGDDPAGDAAAGGADAVRATGSPLPAAEADAERLADLFGSTDRGVLVVGSSPSPPAALMKLASGSGWPVIAEPTSGLRVPGVLAAGQALIGDDRWAERMRPHAVVQAGATPTTRATRSLVAGVDHLAVVDAHHLDPDPSSRASVRIHADPDALAAAIETSPPTADTRWLGRWRAADDRARGALDAFLDDHDEPFEPRVARDVAAWTPAAATLFVGNSTPIRDLDLAMAPRDGMRVLANRGASGIDGLVSTTFGIAAVTPTVALLGDLSFLYDVGALLWSGSGGRGRPPDLVIVVLRNGGGEVFSMLPQRALPEHRELFTTPHQLDLEAVCAAARCGWARVGRAAALTRALDDAVRAGGPQVVEVAIDAERGLALRDELRATVSAALA
jgi:2-succinyl-5-enolpyruvyl-6-hydroxy-3-cyclohexene-1-carboxylate synthase